MGAGSAIVVQKQALGGGVSLILARRREQINRPPGRLRGDRYLYFNRTADRSRIAARAVRGQPEEIDASNEGADSITLRALRLLIVGTSGQLALALRRSKRDAGLTLAAPSRIDVSNRSEVTSLLDAERPDMVVNASAYTNVDHAEHEPERAFAVNASGPRWLAEWCDANRASLIHVSTDYVFDGQKIGGYTEDDPTGPLGVYGASKLAGEEHVRATLERHVILRTSWLFSAQGHNFVKTMLRLAQERDVLRVVSDQHGRPTGADDLAVAILGVAASFLHRQGGFGTFHFAGAGATTWFDFACAIVREQAPYTGRSPEVIPTTSADYPTPAMRPRNSVLDTSAFEAAHGIRPRAWQDGLRETIAAVCRAQAHSPT